MADKSKYILHYAGKEFVIPESQKDLLSDLGSEFGTIKMNLDGGKWLTITHGPGIAIALEERPIRSGRSVTVL